MRPIAKMKDLVPGQILQYGRKNGTFDCFQVVDVHPIGTGKINIQMTNLYIPYDVHFSGDPDDESYGYIDPWAELSMNIREITTPFENRGKSIILKMSKRTLDTLISCIDSVPDQNLRQKLLPYIHWLFAEVHIPVLRLKGDKGLRLDPIEPVGFECIVKIDEDLPYGRVIVKENF